MVVVRLIKEIHTRTAITKYSKIKAGETFKLDGSYYMKLEIENQRGMEQCVRLIDGSVDALEPDTDIVLVDMTIEVTL